MHVDFDDARIRRDLDDVEPLVGRRRVTLDVDGLPESGRRLLDATDEFDVVVGRLRRRQEDTDATLARFDRQGRADDAVDARRTLLHDPLRIGSRGCTVLDGPLFVGVRFRGRQRRPGRERIGRHEVRIALFRYVRERLER
jgi:hypothetical protein